MIKTWLIWLILDRRGRPTWLVSFVPHQNGRGWRGSIGYWDILEHLTDGTSLHQAEGDQLKGWRGSQRLRNGEISIQYMISDTGYCLLSNMIAYYQILSINLAYDIWWYLIYIYIYTLLNDIDINKKSMVPLFDSCIDQTLGSLHSFAHVCLSSSILLYRRIRWNAPSVSFVGEASEEKIPSLCGRKGFWYHPKATIFVKHWGRFCKNWWLVFIDSLKLTSGSGNFQSDRDGHWFYSSGGDTDRDIFEHLNPWSKMTRRWMRPPSPLMI